MSVRGLDRQAIAAVLATLTLSSLVGCGGDANARTATSTDGVGITIVPADQRHPAPDLVGTTVADTHIDLADHLGGHVVLVNVWASWCEPCRQELPVLARASAAHPRSLYVLGLVERDTASAARAFAASKGVTYPSLLDHDGDLLSRLSSMLPANGIPSSLFIDTNGDVAARVVGAITPAELHTVLERLGDQP